MLAIRPLTEEEMITVYHRQITRDFSPDEVKPLFVIQNALRKGEYACFGAYEENTLAAYAFFVFLNTSFGKIALFDYLAVEEGKRNRGVGSWFLQSLMNGVLQDRDCVLLEIENPAYAQDQKELALRLHRQSFYLRNGLRDTGVTANAYLVEYKILELPVGRPHSREQVKKIYPLLYTHRSTGMVKVHEDEIK